MGDVEVVTADDTGGPEPGGGADDELTAGAGVVVSSGAVDGLAVVEGATTTVVIEGDVDDVFEGSASPSAHAPMLSTVAESITAVRPVRAITKPKIGTKQPHAHV